MHACIQTNKRKFSSLFLFTAEDIKLFSTVINWPREIVASLELNKTHLDDQRHKAGLNLMNRCSHTDTHSKHNIHRSPDNKCTFISSDRHS